MKSQVFENKSMSAVLVRLGIPSMLGMLVIAFYNVVDTYYIAALGTEAVGAASVVFPVTMLVSGIAFAFGSGAASSVSRLLGQGDREGMLKTANTALFSALGIATAVAVLIAIFYAPVLRAFGATEAILPYALDYGRIILIGSVINIGTVTSNNLIRAEGFAKISMITMATGAVLNMILDPIFIFRFGWGIQGAAYATILAQTVALVFILAAYKKSEAVVQFSLRYFSTDARIYKEILKVGVLVLIYQGLSSLSMGIINQQAAFFGTEAVAAMGIVTKILAFMSYVIFGFVKGLQPIAGYHYGAGNLEKVSKAIWASLRILTGYALAAAIIAVVGAPRWIGTFTADPAVASLGQEALIAWSASFVLLGIQMTYVTAFLAMGKAKEGSIVGLSRQGLILIPTLIGFRMLFGLKGIVYAQPVADLLTFLLTLVFAKGLHVELKGSQTPVELQKEA